jgi:hypothetical protein
MKTVRSYCVMFVIILLIVSNGKVAYAQGFKFGVGVGVAGFSYSNSNISYNAAFDVGAKLKLDIPLSPFTPVAYVNYYFLTGKFSETPINTTVPINSDITQKILTLGAGAEFKLLPAANLDPYLAVGIDFNHIGEFSFSQSALNLNIPGAVSRTGFNAGAGIMIVIPFVFTIDASVKYAALNVLGKDSNENNINSWTLMAHVLF